MRVSFDDLLAKLPHRDPFRFLTQIREIEQGQSGCAVWSVTCNEPFLAGHFPGRPIVPGVLITEALAQLSGVVAMAGENEIPEGRLAHVDIRFKGPAVPPLDIVLRCQSTRVMGNLHQFDVSAEHEGKALAIGSLTLAFHHHDMSMNRKSGQFETGGA